ncbi:MULTISPECIES: hypothetical protein [Virgibacillus]|uniref:DUF4181 domain-containing protein n=1 Tax=Virgibacillus siamensis TaxID=480071 RepID=A0ABP3R9G4_9BACI|nr:hypothetical protein [Virgibacillus ihumii]
MSEKVWKTLRITGLVVGFSIFLFLISYFETPQDVSKSYFGISLIVILFVCAIFLIFDRIKVQVTEEVNVKTFIYTGLVLIIMYLMAKII